VALSQGSRLEVAAGQHGIQRLVHRVKRNELARLEGRTVIEVRREWLRVWTFVAGPLYCLSSTFPRIPIHHMH
jgi:hypothetical protein